MFLQAHSGFRYFVLLMGVVVIAYAAFGLATRRDYDKRMRVLSAVFTGMIDLTVLLGLMVMFSARVRPNGAHVVMMIMAAVLAHAVHGVMKRRPAEEQTYTPHVIGGAIVLGLVVAGIMALGHPVIG